MIKSDRWIKRMALEEKMIDPFVDHQVSEGHISYGLSSFGYDIRVADEFNKPTAVFQKQDYTKSTPVTLPAEFPNPVWIVQLLKGKALCVNALAER